MKSYRRRKVSSSSDRDSSPEIHERNARSRTYDSSRSGYSRNRGGRGGRRDEIEDNYSDSREDTSYSEDDENKFNVRRNQIPKNGRNSNNQNNENDNYNNNNSRSNSNTSKNNRDNNNRNISNKIDKENIEETLAVQTMSLIHGQLTAMKQQLLAISDVPPTPSASSSNAYPLDISLSGSQFNGSRISKGK